MFMQLNQYKLMDQVGQGSYSIVKLAYNVAEDTNYVSTSLMKMILILELWNMVSGNENSFKKETSEESWNFWKNCSNKKRCWGTNNQKSRKSSG